MLRWAWNWQRRKEREREREREPQSGGWFKTELPLTSRQFDTQPPTSPLRRSRFSVFPCDFIDTSQSGEETPEESFRGSWICEIGKLSVSLLSILHFPRPFFPSSVRFSRVYSYSCPLSGSSSVDPHRGRQPAFGYREHWRATWRYFQRIVIISFFAVRAVRLNFTSTPAENVSG